MSKIFERNGDQVYVRDAGVTTRTLLYTIPNDTYESKLWDDILLTSKSNAALKVALDNVILLYRLSKDDPK